MNLKIIKKTCYRGKFDAKSDNMVNWILSGKDFDCSFPRSGPSHLLNLLHHLQPQHLHRKVDKLQGAHRFFRGEVLW